MHSQRRKLLGLALAVAGLPCHASLGGAPSSSGNTPGSAAGTTTGTTAGTTSVRHVRALAAGGGSASYEVHARQLAGGTTVREYVARGVVFAVAWKGPFMPDLRDLLGRHFETLTAETARRPRGGKSQVRIARSDVTIESTGHMRAYAGRAWINGQLPAGFDTDEIE